MILNFDQFTKAAAIVKTIIDAEHGKFDDSEEGESALKTLLVNAAEGIPDDKTKKEFYRHINSLFLNILLNRLDEVGKEGKQRAVNARNIIVGLINEII